MSVVVRKAVGSDLDAIEQLYDDLNDSIVGVVEGPRWVKGVYPLRSDAEEGFAADCLYVAEMEGVIAGTVMYLNEEELSDPYKMVKWQKDFPAKETVVIHILAVHPKFQGKGVGKALLDHACVVGKEKGIKAVRLDVYETNVPAIRLYEKCGFKLVGMVDLGLEEIYGLKWYKAFEKLIEENV